MARVPTRKRYDMEVREAGGVGTISPSVTAKLPVSRAHRWTQLVVIPSEGHNSGVQASDDSQSISSSSSIHDKIEPDHEFDPAGVGVDIPGQPGFPGKARKAPDRLVLNVTASMPDAPLDRCKVDFDSPSVKEALQRQVKQLWVQAIFEKQLVCKNYSVITPHSLRASASLHVEEYTFNS
jgi:hypothetical protein